MGTTKVDVVVMGWVDVVVVGWGCGGGGVGSTKVDVVVVGWGLLW